MERRGGKRAGAGRKSKAEKFAPPIARAEKRIADRLPDLIDFMFELAEGVTVKEKDAHGGTRVYTRAPDRQANEYLLNRIMGKPVERAEIAGPEGGPLEVVVRYADGPAEPAPVEYQPLPALPDD